MATQGKTPKDTATGAAKQPAKKTATQKAAEEDAAKKAAAEEAAKKKAEEEAAKKAAAEAARKKAEEEAAKNTGPAPKLIKVKFTKPPFGKFKLPYYIGQEKELPEPLANEVIGAKYGEKV